MQLTFWWDHFEGLQCSFAFLSNVHGIYWILRRRWTVRNKCTKSKSSPEKADQRGSPLTDYSGCLSSLLSDTSLYKLLLKVILCQNKWITNFSLLPKFAKFTYISTFRLKKKGKTVTALILTFNCIIWPHAFYINQIPNRQQNSSQLLNKKEKKNHFCKKKVQFHFTNIEIKILRKHQHI